MTKRISVFANTAKTSPACVTDEPGLCDRIFLDDDRRFNIKLDENFEVDTVSHNDKSFFVIKHDIYFICFNL